MKTLINQAIVIKKSYIYDNAIFTIRVILKKSEAVVHQPGR